MKEAEAITSEILKLTDIWEKRLNELPDEVISVRRNSQNRTIKQILGHLIDSASNNVHRIIHLQYQPGPFEFPNYATFGNNDRWIAIQNYQDEEWKSMIQLWKYLNFHLCHVIENVNDEHLGKEWIAGPGRKLTLESMIAAYTPHFNLHLTEIDELIKQ
ncbi:MAG: DinB family protein [Bacteroidales bacterium]|jgi:predicted MPP superfamily phosphohydrolase